ncbi:Osmotin, thaumatin-like protein [Testicularia cyperi]|uniref:Osmotin, thaumatin-like protein n=1 Tax=Testicularia cyperi TaxID=1882483 RepID=A0A317Y232_9BASI|nr:Osmotin, thaumatin-like protein [Testicularia cyperi]
MVAIGKLAVAVVTFISMAGAVVLPERSTSFTFTVTNNCKHDFAPIFRPSLPGRKTWATIKSKKSDVYSFKSDDYVGKVFSPLRNANTKTGAGATIGEFDLSTGDYDISLAKGYNVGMSIYVLGKQFNDYCMPATCDSRQCTDAYKDDSGLLTASREGSDNKVPNHSCPPSFGRWTITFCP